jgi:hypothetical protein
MEAAMDSRAAAAANARVIITIPTSHIEQSILIDIVATPQACDANLNRMLTALNCPIQGTLEESYSYRARLVKVSLATQT